MNRFYSFAAFAVMLIVLGIPVLAQPVITGQDRIQIFSKDYIWNYYASDANGNTFDLGEPGGENFYDFTQFHYGLNVTENSLTHPSESPYGGEFPNATHYQRQEDQDGITHMYYIIDETGFYSAGFVIEVPGQTITVKYTPPFQEEHYPIEYGANITEDTGLKEITPGFWQGITQKVTCDRYGTMRTMGGDVPCLVLRKELKFTIRMTQGGQSEEAYGRNVLYQFLSKNGITANMYIDTLTEGSTTPTMLGLFIASTDELVDAGSVPEIPTTTDVFVYPNPAPAGSISTFKWEQESAGFVSLALYDMTGRIVREIHEGDYPAGIHSIRIPLGGVAPGTYIVRLTSGTSSASKLLTIIR